MATDLESARGLELALTRQGDLEVAGRVLGELQSDALSVSMIDLRPTVDGASGHTNDFACAAMASA